jgi:hypothetical protein
MKQFYCLDFETQWPAYLLYDIEAMNCIGWPCKDKDGFVTLYLHGHASGMDN